MYNSSILIVSSYLFCISAYVDLFDEAPREVASDRERESETFQSKYEAHTSVIGE